LNKLILHIKLKALLLSAFFVLSFGLQAQKSNIELVHSDLLTNAIVFENAIKVTGNVHFKHENKNLFCDSAYFHQTDNWIRAYGNVHLNQADTLNLFCDSLFYDGNSKIGILRSNVRFRDNEFKMTTDSLEFDTDKNIGYYSNWAVITSIKQDIKLTSKEGYYLANSKSFFFKDSVDVKHPKYQLQADTLEFNTAKEMVLFHGPTHITLDSTIIDCNKGYYDTKIDFINLWQGATIQNDSATTLYADSLIYDQSVDIAEGFYNVSVYDSIKNIQFKSDYLIKYPNNESITLKHNARVYQYGKVDTLFFRADTIYQTTDSLSKNIINAVNNVVIINANAVGICDSIYYNEGDSIIKLRKTPIIWNEDTQLSGDTINMTLDNNNIDKIYLKNNALVITKHDSIHFDQLSGKEITADFVKNDIHEIFIDKNAQTLYYPSEESKDSLNTKIKTLKGQNHLVCDQIYVYFKKSEIQKIKFIDKPEAIFSPIDQIPEKKLFLTNFIWKIELKPSTEIPK
jgi:lipopolysaccharide export system protein LptA